MYEDMGELRSWLTELRPGNQSATLQGLIFPMSTASPDLCQQLTRMPFHLGGPQHKRSCHFPYLLPFHRSTACKLSVCPTPFTFRRDFNCLFASLGAQANPFLREGRRCQQPALLTWTRRPHTHDKHGEKAQFFETKLVLPLSRWRSGRNTAARLLDCD